MTTKGDVLDYRGTKVTVVDSVVSRTPTGGRIEQVLIQRARAGSKWVMAAELTEVGQATKIDVPGPEVFR